VNANGARLAVVRAGGTGGPAGTGGADVLARVPERRHRPRAEEHVGPATTGGDLAFLPAAPALLHDDGGRVVAVSPALVRLAGLPDDRQLLGRRVAEFVVTEFVVDVVGSPLPPTGPAAVGGGGTAAPGGERAHLLCPHAAPVPVRLVRWDTIPGTVHHALLLLDVSDAADTVDLALPILPGPAAGSDPAASDPAASDPAASDPVSEPAADRAPSRGHGGRHRVEDAVAGGRWGSWEHDLTTGRWTFSAPLRVRTDGAGSDDAVVPVTLSTAAVAALVHPDDRARLDARWRALLEDGQLLDAEFRSAAGERLWHVRGSRVGGRGRDGVAVGTAEDVTDRRTTELALRTSAQRFTDLLALAPVGIALFDDDGRLVQANQTLCRLLGAGQDALRGRHADDLLDPDVEAGGAPGRPLLARPAGTADPVSWTCGPRALRRLGRGGRSGPGDSAGADGPVWCELHVSVSLRDGAATYLVVLTDVSATRRVEESLRHLAMHDELTGLPNRRALTATVGHLLQGPTARRVGVLSCDLDSFGRVNDSLGHDAGDELLVALASRLRDRLPAGCSATRYSGDEFVVVCADVDLHGGLDKLTGSVAAVLRTAVPVHGQLVRVSATVGAAVGAGAGVSAGSPDAPSALPTLDPDGDPVAQVLRYRAGPGGTDPRDPADPTEDEVGHRGVADLLRFADAALSEAKSAGAGRVVLADEAIMRGADEALRLEGELREALVHDELVVHFQPVVGPDGQVQTAEALVRWQHPERGLLYPDSFLPTAAAADLMGELDRWVLRTAVREAARWPAPVAVAVNVAGLLPGDPDFLPVVRDAVAAAGLPWDRLVLELVETSLADLPARGLGEMHELISLGVRFAVDDFGTGWSSLSRLTGLPAQIVKLDRGFVRGVATGEGDRAVARAVVELAAAVGRTCVAEGVEDAAQFAVLRDLGVDAYQGWLFARAMPGEAFAAVLAEGPIAPHEIAG